MVAVPPSLKNAKYETTPLSILIGAGLMAGMALDDVLDQFEWEDIDKDIPDLFEGPRLLEDNPDFKGINFSGMVEDD